MKKTFRIIEIIEVFWLCTLLVVRLCVKSDQNNWITLLNVLGLIITCVSFWSNVYNRCSGYKKMNMVTGIFLVVLLFLTILAALVFAEIITLNTKCNDLILIVTLLLSLPVELLTSIIANMIKD